MLATDTPMTEIDDEHDDSTGDATLEGRVWTLIEPVVQALAFEVVRVQLSGNRHPRLQVMVEPNNGGPMTVDDCAKISRAISAQLDVEDPIEAAYTLEVSSPGLDRPLTRPKDFDRFAGFEARVEVANAIDGRKRFQGTLIGREGDLVSIQSGDTRFDLPFADVKKAKLVITDKLLAQAETMQ